MSPASQSDPAQRLLELLLKGLTVVEPRQGYKARNRVTCICVVDIDNDGDMEIIFGCADGRLTVLSRDCEIRWSRIIGDKSPVTAIAILPRSGGIRSSHMIVAGTERGYLYVFDKHGQIVKKDGDRNLFTSNYSEEDEKECWFTCDQAINQISVPSGKTPPIIFSSEDSHVYALRGSDGTPLWRPFHTSRWARCVFAGDLKGDRNFEVLASTTNNYLYRLDHNGTFVKKLKMEHPVRTLFAVDLDRDGIMQILVTTDKGDLIALASDFHQLWCTTPFNNRMRACYVADIDRDGENEIIAGGDDKYVYILNKRGEILWRHLLESRIVSITAGDIDEDGVQEVIIGTDDDRVDILHIDLARPREGLYEQIQQALAESSGAVLTQLTPGEHELLQDITHTGREEPIDVEQAEEPLHQEHFKDALTAFLLLERQKVQVHWQKKTEYESKLLHFGSALSDLIVGTTDGTLRGYNTEGTLLWSCQLPEKDQILSAQVGRIQGPSYGQDDILICSTDRQIYLIGYPPGSARSKKNTSPKVLNKFTIDPMISSVALKSESRNPEVVFGSEDQKIYIYRNGLDQPREHISTNQSVRIVQLYPSKHKSKQAPDIIAAKADHHVAAYKYGSEEELWNFKTWNRIRSITVKDIDGDNHEEIIVGSDDRNVHVIDDQGYLKWRYYLPYSVLSTHVVDIDQDGYQEVLAGCADGYLYVLNNEGELLWKYQVDERITAIASRKYEDTVEIALGTESKVELVRMIDPAYLQENIDRCWQHLVGEQSEEQVLKGLLEIEQNPALRAFALQKSATVFTCTREKQELFQKFVKDNSVIVRQAIVSGLMNCYSSDPVGIQPLLEKLFTDRERDVRLTLVAHVDQLMRHDWATGWDYLTRFAENVDRFVRRAVMRKLYSLINEPDKGYWQESYWGQIFQLLLVGVRDEKSTWVRQEAAHALARFLEQRPWDILYAIYLFLLKDVQPDALEHMAHHVTRQQTLRETLTALVLLLRDDVHLENAVDRLDLSVQILAHIQDSKFGKDTWLLFNELHDLFNLQTLQDIAHYQSHLKNHQPNSENLHFTTAKRVFESIPNVTRILKVYLHRQHINDRITSLQEACRAIDRLRHFMQKEYRMALSGEALTRWPDYKFLDLLFKRWWDLAQSTLNELRGKPELKAALLTRELHYEQAVSILLEIKNVGRSPAYSVRAALLHNDDFSVAPPTVAQTEILFWNETLKAEFTIQFATYIECLDLQLEVTFDDGEEGFRKQTSTEQLILRPIETGEYEFIPNPYSTGTPVNDKSMFFGRDNDIEVLKRELTLHTAQRIIVLHGLRRSGKTSLLRYLVKNDILDNCIPIYIDMQNIIHEVTTDRLFYKIAFQMHRTIVQKKRLKLAAPEPSRFKEDASFAFDRFLDEVEVCVQGQQRIVLLIDEFEILDQQAERGQFAPTLFEYLRSLMQDRNINFLLAGTHKIEQLTREYWSVFYGLVLPHRLSKISPEGAYKLITLPVKPQLTYDPFVIDKIRQLTGDQPFLLNSFCRILIDRCNELRKTHVSLYDVNALLPYAVQIMSLQFDGLWQQLSLEEQCALAAIAWEGRDRALSYAEIESVYRAERIPYEPQQLRDALGFLAQQDLLESVMEGDERDNLRYRISIGLLKAWLSQERALTSLKQKRSNYKK